MVNDVAPDGPAAQAGIRANDVIISVNDKPAVSALETMDQVAEIRPGSEIPVVIMRDDKKITLHIAVQNTRPPTKRLSGWGLRYLLDTGSAGNLTRNPVTMNARQ